jgi:predicted 3-demethylubiquinone-9 3-methyltransferase (glyoxalase superfamily)
MSKITSCLWFDKKAEEAARFYVSLLPGSRIDFILPYCMEMPGGSPGDVMLVECTLAGQSYLALNGGSNFQFTPAVSFSISCADQAEVDRLWDTLCEGGSPGQCGWLKDRYGVSWQIVPTALIEMMKDKDPTKVRRVTEAMLPMTKPDIGALRKAYNSEATA